MSTAATLVAAVALGMAGLLSVARVVRGGTVADRALGLDVAVVVLAAAMVTDAARSDGSVFLGVVTVVCLLAFVATVTLARFVEPDDEQGVGTAPMAEEER